MIDIYTLKVLFDKKLGSGTWEGLESETLALELNLPVTSLLLDEISVLKIIVVNPSLFFQDPIFMVYATEVINGTSADFDYIPHITSLEIAYAIFEVALVLGVQLNDLPMFGTGPKILIKNVLVNEGYSVPVPPFDVVGMGQLTPGQTEQDTADKEKAIKEYINAIRDKSTA